MESLAVGKVRLVSPYLNCGDYLPEKDEIVSSNLNCRDSRPEKGERG